MEEKTKKPLKEKESYKALKARDKQKIIDKFLLSNMIDEYESLYNTVLSK